MKAFHPKEIYGNWVPVFLDIQEDESIDYSQIEAQLDHYKEAQVNGIYTNGTASEFYNQSLEEFYKISKIVASYCEKNNLPFQLGASHMAPNESLKRVELAASLQPCAIQVILPDWFPPNRDTQVSFLEKVILAAKGIGIVLYNPPHSKVILLW